MVKTAIQQLKKGLTSVRSLLLAVKWIFIYGKRAGYRYLFPVLIATVVAGAMMPLQLWALGKIVDAFVIDMRFTQIALYVLPWIIFMIACRFIGDLLEDWGLMRRRYLEEKMTLSIQTDLFQKSTDVAFEYFEDEAYYNQLQRANEGMGAAFLGMVFQIFSILESMVKLVGLSIIVMQGHWLIPFILFIAGIPIFKLQNKFNINRYELVYNQTSELRLMDYFVNLLSSREAAKEVRLYSANTYLVGRWKTLYEKLRVQRLQQSVRQRIIIGAVESLYVLTFGVSLLLLILSLQAGQLSLGVFVTVIYAVISMQEEWEWTIRWVGWTHEDYLDFARDLLTFLALPEQSKKPLSITSKAVKIELINVSYTYPNTTYKVLNNIHLTIEPGEKIALLGENGSGKSTLVKLMSGLLQPTEGEILVNGQKLEHLGSIWEETSVVFQDFAQYHMTVKENIGLGDTRKIEEAATIQDAAEKGGAAEFVNAWPQEMETMLGATFGGHDLSGGQWQKVATSRGFMPDAKLFILDEPTAALDAFSEEKVYERFQKMAGKQTALLISHRIGFARLADQIIVLKAGQLEEQGTHEALEKNNGEYANLLRVQTQWYEED